VTGNRDSRFTQDSDYEPDGCVGFIIYALADFKNRFHETAIVAEVVERTSAMSGSHQKPAPPGYVWVFPREVRHWRSGEIMRRKDGKRFAFLVRAK
jgi:flavin-dependent dehydrogenase